MNEQDFNKLTPEQKEKAIQIVDDIQVAQIKIRNAMKEKTFAITLTYPLTRMGGLNPRVIDERKVNLEISTNKKLPQEFFDELMTLVDKYENPLSEKEVA